MRNKMLRKISVLILSLTMVMTSMNLSFALVDGVETPAEPSSEAMTETSSEDAVSNGNETDVVVDKDNTTTDENQMIDEELASEKEDKSSEAESAPKKTASKMMLKLGAQNPNYIYGDDGESIIGVYATDGKIAKSTLYNAMASFAGWTDNATIYWDTNSSRWNSFLSNGINVDDSGDVSVSKGDYYIYKKNGTRATTNATRSSDKFKIVYKHTTQLSQKTTPIKVSYNSSWKVDDLKTSLLDDIYNSLQLNSKYRSNRGDYDSSYNQELSSYSKEDFEIISTISDVGTFFGADKKATVKVSFKGKEISNQIYLGSSADITVKATDFCNVKKDSVEGAEVSIVNLNSTTEKLDVEDGIVVSATPSDGYVIKKIIVKESDGDTLGCSEWQKSYSTLTDGKTLTAGETYTVTVETSKPVLENVVIPTSMIKDNPGSETAAYTLIAQEISKGISGLPEGFFNGIQYNDVTYDEGGYPSGSAKLNFVPDKGQIFKHAFGKNDGKVTTSSQSEDVKVTFANSNYAGIGTVTVSGTVTVGNAYSVTVTDNRNGNGGKVTYQNSGKWREVKGSTPILVGNELTLKVQPNAGYKVTSVAVKHNNESLAGDFYNSTNNTITVLGSQSYQLGDTCEVTINYEEKLPSNLKTKDNPVFNNILDINEQNVLNAIIDIANSTPNNFTANDVKIEYLAHEDSGAFSASDDWESLGFTPGFGQGLSHHAFGTKTQEKVRVTFKENDTYKQSETVQVTVTIDNRAASSIKLKSGITFPYYKDLYDDVEAALFSALVEETIPDLTAASDKLTITYLAHEDSGFLSASDDWESLGFTPGFGQGLSHHAFGDNSADGYKERVRFHYNGEGTDYIDCTAEVEVTVKDIRDSYTVTFASNPVYYYYEGKTFANANELPSGVYDAVVSSITDGEGNSLSYDKVSIQYYSVYFNLSLQDDGWSLITDDVKQTANRHNFGTNASGSEYVRINYQGDANHKPFTSEAKQIKIVDPRKATAITGDTSNIELPFGGSYSTALNEILSVTYQDGESIKTLPDAEINYTGFDLATEPEPGESTTVEITASYGGKEGEFLAAEDIKFNVSLKSTVDVYKVSVSKDDNVDSVLLNNTTYSAERKIPETDGFTVVATPKTGYVISNIEIKKKGIENPVKTEEWKTSATVSTESIEKNDEFIVNITTVQLTATLNSAFSVSRYDSEKGLYNRNSSNELRSDIVEEQILKNVSNLGPDAFFSKDKGGSVSVQYLAGNDWKPLYTHSVNDTTIHDFGWTWKNGKQVFNIDAQEKVRVVYENKTNFPGIQVICEATVTLTETRAESDTTPTLEEEKVQLTYEASGNYSTQLNSKIALHKKNDTGTTISGTLNYTFDKTVEVDEGQSENYTVAVAFEGNDDYTGCTRNVPVLVNRAPEKYQVNLNAITSGPATVLVNGIQLNTETKPNLRIKENTDFSLEVIPGKDQNGDVYVVKSVVVTQRNNTEGNLVNSNDYTNKFTVKGLTAGDECTVDAVVEKVEATIANPVTVNGFYVEGEKIQEGSLVQSTYLPKVKNQITAAITKACPDEFFNKATSEITYRCNTTSDKWDTLNHKLDYSDGLVHTFGYFGASLLSPGFKGYTTGYSETVRVTYTYQGVSKVLTTKVVFADTRTPTEIKLYDNADPANEIGTEDNPIVMDFGSDYKTVLNGLIEGTKSGLYYKNESEQYALLEDAGYDKLVFDASTLKIESGVPHPGEEGALNGTIKVQSTAYTENDDYKPADSKQVHLKFRCPSDSCVIEPIVTKIDDKDVPALEKGYYTVKVKDVASGEEYSSFPTLHKAEADIEISAESSKKGMIPQSIQLIKVGETDEVVAEANYTSVLVVSGADKSKLLKTVNEENYKLEESTVYKIKVVFTEAKLDLADSEVELYDVQNIRNEEIAAECKTNIEKAIQVFGENSKLPSDFLKEGDYTVEVLYHANKVSFTPDEEETQTSFIGRLFDRITDKIKETSIGEGLKKWLESWKSVDYNINSVEEFFKSTGAHNFGYKDADGNITDEVLEGNTEEVMVTITNTKYGISVSDTAIATVKDSRIPTVLTCDDFEMFYEDDLRTLVKEQMSLTTVPTDEKESKNVEYADDELTISMDHPDASSTPYAVEIKYLANNRTYKPSSAKVGVKVKKSPADIDVERTVVTYDGDKHLPTIKRTPEFDKWADPQRELDYMYIVAGVDAKVSGFVSIEIPKSTQEKLKLGAAVDSKAVDTIVETLTRFGVSEDKARERAEKIVEDLGKITGSRLDEVSIYEYLKKELNEGVTLSELEKIIDNINNTLITNIGDEGSFAKMIGVDPELFSKLLEQLKDMRLSEHVKIRIAEGPVDSGIYGVSALILDKNYQTDFGTSELIIKQRGWEKADNVYLEFKEKLAATNKKEIDKSMLEKALKQAVDKELIPAEVYEKMGFDEFFDKTKANVLTIDQASKFDFGVNLVDGNIENGIPIDPDWEHYVHKLYFGMEADGQVRLVSDGTAPTKPGLYTEIAYVILGNYVAKPIARIYRVQKNPGQLNWNQIINFNSVMLSDEEQDAVDLLNRLGMEKLTEYGIEKYQKAVSAHVISVEELTGDDPFKFGGYLSDKKDAENSQLAPEYQKNVKTLYVGMTYEGKNYLSETAPDTAGVYTEVVYVLFGDYKAKPIIRTFKIDRVATQIELGEASEGVKDSYEYTYAPDLSYEFYGKLLRKGEESKYIDGKDVSIKYIGYQDRETGAYTSEAPKDAGIYLVRASFAGDGMYKPADETAILTIKQADLPLTISMADWVYGETPSEPEIEGNFEHGAIESTIYSIDGQILDIPLLTGKPSDAGSYKVTIAVAPTRNYKGNTATTTFKVLKRPVDFSWGEETRFTFDNDEHAPTCDIAPVTTINGVKKTAVVGKDNVYAKVSGAKVHAGNYTATAELAGLDKKNYVLVDNAKTECPFEITKRVIGINWYNDVFTYDSFYHEPIALATNYRGLEIPLLKVTVDEGIEAGEHTATAAFAYDGSLFYNDYALPEDTTHKFMINARNINEANFEAINTVYNAESQDPNVSGYDWVGPLKKLNLVENEDYTYRILDASLKNEVADPVDAGNYAIEITGRGNYASKQYISWTISKAKPTCEVKGKRGLAYNGLEQNLIKEAGLTGLAATDDTTCGIVYDVKDSPLEVLTGFNWKNTAEVKNAGTYYVYYKVDNNGDTNYTDGDIHYVKVTVRKAKLTADMITLKYPEYTYDGKEHSPKIIVKIGDKVLPKSDYYVYKAFPWSSDFSAVDAGEYHLYITADLYTSGNLYDAGLVIDKTWKINAKPVRIVFDRESLTTTYGDNGRAKAYVQTPASKDRFTLKPILTYTGTSFTGVKYNGTKVPTEAGVYTVTATINDPNYMAKPVKAKFVVKRKSIEDGKVNYGDALIYNGEEQTQEVVSVTGVRGKRGRQLDVTFDVAHNSATEPGAYKLVVKGTGNFKGRIVKSFAIAPDTAEGDVYDLGKGSVEMKVTADENVEAKYDIGALIKSLVETGELDAEKLSQVADGEEVILDLTVKDVTGETEKPQTYDKFKIGQEFEINLKMSTFKDGMPVIEGLEVKETTSAIAFKLKLNDALINTNKDYTRDYVVIREHDGSTSTLSSAYNKNDNSISFSTNKFSYYAVGYVDTKKDVPAVPTGDQNDVLPYEIFGGLALAAMIAMLANRRRKEN